MIVQFLSFRRHCAEQRSSGIDQSFSLQNFSASTRKYSCSAPTDGVTFLDVVFPNNRSRRKDSLSIASMERRSGVFLVERFTGIRTKCSRNTKYRPRCILSYKCRRSAIPCRISSRLKCSAQSARRKGRRIRLAFDQFFSRETHQHLAARQRCGNKESCFYVTPVNGRNQCV